MAWTAPRTWTDGELVTAAIMNPHIRDNQLAMGPHLIVRKTIDESVTSSTAFQADDVLTLPVSANEVWQWELFLLATSDSAADIKLRWTFPAGGTFSAQSNNSSGADVVQRVGWATTTSPAVEWTGTANFNTSTVASMIIVQGIYVNGGTGGNMALEWAQAASSGTPTVVKANSTLWAVKLA